MRPSAALSVMLVGSMLGAALTTDAVPRYGPKETKRWTEKFTTAACTWSSTGRNDFFILEPGDQAIFEGREGKDRVRVESTVLNETRQV